MAVTPVNLFTLHGRSWQNNRYVYPVISRRSKGLSIGINLNPDKACNFDCIYCCVDRRTPPVYRDVEIPILADELQQMLALAASGDIWKISPFDQTRPELRRLNDVAFSGDGEPTSFPQFGQTCELAAGLLQTSASSVESQAGLASTKIILITNATLFHRPPVQRALEFLDQHNGEIWAKLEAGTEEYYRLIERTSIPLRQVLDNITSAGRVRPIVIQSLFMNVHGQPPSDAEIIAYVDRLRESVKAGCQIKLVQVYTVARQVAESYVTALTPAQLGAIADRVRQLNLPVETYDAPT